jgi:hypothetical protein
MAKRSTEPRPVSLDIDGFPGASVYRTGPGEYWPCYLGVIVGGQMYRTADEAEPAAIAAWVQAHPSVQVAADEAAELALDERAADYDAEAALAEQREPLTLCEICGAHVIDPADAEEFAGLMVCFRCAPAATLRRADVFDALVEAADEARAYWSHVPTRRKVYDNAFDWLLGEEVYSFNAAGDLLYPSKDEHGNTKQVYRVGLSCECDAGRWGRHCTHGAIVDIIGRARRMARMKFAA